MVAGIVRLSSAASTLSRSLLGRVRVGRAFGSASAAQLDYDYFSGVEEEAHRPEVDSAAWFPARGVQWVVIGDRGAKKHLYAERLSKLLQVPHISMGTLVRQELSPSSSLYKEITKAINEGKLVPEDIIFALLSKRLEEGYQRGESGFILDGIPRTRIQAEILDQIADVDLVVNLKSTEQEKDLVTANPNLIAQNGQQISHSTESKEMFKEKMRIYTEQSKALEDYYRKQKKIVDFEVRGEPVETWQGLLAALRIQHINALSSSSQKLTA